MNKKTLMAIVFFSLAALPAYGQTDTLGLAKKIVEDFHSEAVASVAGLDKTPEVKAFENASVKTRDNALAEIKSIRWSEGPGKRRFQRVQSVVDGYTASEINEARKLGSTLAGDKKTAFDGSLTRLAEKRKKGLSDIEAMRSTEVPDAGAQKAVPIIDRSRYDEEPGATKGIWER